MTTTERLRSTVHVSATGVVTHGRKVKVTAANRRSADDRIVASTPYRAHARRFAPGGVPAGVDLNITTPGHALVCGTGLGCPPKVAS